MLKWIKNSTASKTNKSSKYRGIRFISGKYQANVKLSRYDAKGKRIQTDYVIGSYETEREAKNERVKFILNLL